MEGVQKLIGTIERMFRTVNVYKPIRMDLDGEDEAKMIVEYTHGGVYRITVEKVET